MNSGIFSAIPALSADILGNPVWAWLTALLMAGAVCLALKLVRDIFAARLEKLAASTPYRTPHFMLGFVHAVNPLFLAVAGLWLAAMLLNLPQDLRRIIADLLILAFLLQGGLWASIAISVFWEHYFQRQSGIDNADRRSLISLVALVSKLVLWTLVFLVILGNLGINVTALITGLGIGGVAIALSVQRLLGDFLAYVMIVLDRTFEVGDFIIVGAFKGAVEKIGIRTTLVRSLDGEQLIFPNSDLLNSRIQNFKSLRERRAAFSVGVAYETSPDLLAKTPATLQEIIKAQEKTRFERAHFKQLGDSALIFEVVYHVLDPDYLVYMNIQQNINLGICRKFKEQGIEIAYPTQTVFVKGAA